MIKIDRKLTETNKLRSMLINRVLNLWQRQKWLHGRELQRAGMSGRIWERSLPSSGMSDWWRCWWWWWWWWDKRDSYIWLAYPLDSLLHFSDQYGQPVGPACHTNIDPNLESWTDNEAEHMVDIETRLGQAVQSVLFCTRLYALEFATLHPGKNTEINISNEYICNL